MSSFIDVIAVGRELRAQGTEKIDLAFDPVRSEDETVNNTLLAGWHHNGQSLHVVADRLGMIPIFIKQLAGRIVVSDSLKALVSRLPEVRMDHDALSIFFRLGYFLGNDTPFEGIRVLGPGEELRWSGSTILLDEPSYLAPRIFQGTRQEAIRTYSTLFSSSIKRRIFPERKHSLPLSGGRDSRHILFELLKCQHNPYEVVTARTIGNGSAEVKTASALASRFDLTHRIIELNQADWVSRELEKNELTHCLSDEHAWYLSVEETVYKQADITFDGIGGDVLSNGLYFDAATLTALNADELDKAAEMLLPKCELAYLGEPLRKTMSFEVARARLKRELKRHLESPNALKSFYFWNRTRREIAVSPICIAARSRQVSLPYLDPELMTFLMSLPAGEFGSAGFHDEVIDTCFRTDIPYAQVNFLSPSAEDVRLATGPALIFLLAQGGLRHADLVFALPRILRATWQGASNEMWWINNLIYLKSLDQCSGHRMII